MNRVGAQEKFTKVRISLEIQIEILGRVMFPYDVNFNLTLSPPLYGWCSSHFFCLFIFSLIYFFQLYLYIIEYNSVYVQGVQIMI